MKAYETTPELIDEQRRKWAFLGFAPGRWQDDQDLSEDVEIVALSQIKPNRFDYIEETVERYQRAIEAGEKFPPIVIQRYPHEIKYTIRDGTHRDLASRRAGMDGIPSLIRRPQVLHE